MSINGLFFNSIEEGGVYDRTYSAEDFSSYLNQVVGSGVFPNPSTQLQVRADSGMNIIVGAGEGIIDGHKIINTADMQLSLSDSDALLNRIDRVIFYCDYVNRKMGIEVLEGTAATSPTAPELTRTTSRYEMSLATITVNKQITAVTDAMITDTRADSDVCGWVAGLIQQVDTSTLFVQWQTAYSNYYNTMTAEFNAWMETLTEELKINTFIQQYTKTVSLTASSSKTIALDMTDYTYASTDIIYVFINGLLGVNGTDYYIDTSTATPSVQLSLTGSTDMTDIIEVRALKSIIGVQSTT